MKYYFYIDESWDLSLDKINPDFPYFELCGVLISEEENNKLIQYFREIKIDIFNSENIIFHSHEIRKQKNDFVVLRNPNLRQKFYDDFNEIIRKVDFTILCAIVKKEKYKKKIRRYCG